MCFESRTRARATTANDGDDGLAMTAVSDEANDRVAWANAMRLCVTRRDALNDDGSIDQQFFKPKRVVFETRAKKWGDEERAKLYEGIETYGIQEWGTIRENLLPDWDTLNLRVKAARLMGTQSLSRYPKGWKGTKSRGRGGVREA